MQSSDMLNRPQADSTRILQESPLIIDSDTRNNVGPYIGVFPPASVDPSIVFVDSNLAKIAQAASWPCWKMEVPTTSDPCWESRLIPDKGIGLVAKRKILAGQLIMAERPVYICAIRLTVHPDRLPESKTGTLEELALGHLSEEARTAVSGLANSYPATMRHEITGRLATNTLRVASLSMRPNDKESKDHEGYALCCPSISRINHSCAPNLHYYLHFEDLTVRLRAYRDIAAGEELSITYAPILDTFEARNKLLQEKYFFTCDCSVCSLPPSERESREANRSFLRKVLEELEPIDRNTTSRQDVSKAIVLADREEIYEVLPKLWHWGSRNGLEMGWLTIKQQIDWLKKARMWYERMEGPSGQGVADMNTLIGVLGKYVEQS